MRSSRLPFLLLFLAGLTALVCLAGCQRNQKPAEYVSISDTLEPHELSSHYRMTEFEGKRVGSLFQIERNGANMARLAEYIARLPSGPFLERGQVYYYSIDMAVEKVTCQRQIPFTNRVYASESSHRMKGPPRPEQEALEHLWTETQSPPRLLQFQCDLDSGNGLYWGHIIQTFLLRHHTDDQYRLIFEYGYGSKHEDEINYPDMDHDGQPEIWIKDNEYGSVSVLIEKQNAAGIYGRIFQYPIFRLPQPGCYGYDGELNVIPGPGSMPHLLLVAHPLFNEEGGCWPAANSEDESKAYVAAEMERIRGSYRFVFGGYGYQGSEELKNLRSDD